MSVEISVPGVERALWEALVAAWAASQDMPLGDTTPEEDGTVHLYVAGSIRGVIAWFEEETGRGTVRLSHLASRADWAITRELLAAAVEAGGAPEIDDEPLETDALAPSAWGARARAQVHRDVHLLRTLLREHGGPLSLPGPGWALSVAEADLAGEPVIVETRLATRAGRYAGAEPARAFQVRGPDGEQRVSVWPWVPTRVEAIDELVIEVPGGFGLVPFAQVAAIVGSAVEALGGDPPCWYLPLLGEDDPRRAALVAAARPLR